MFELDSMGVPIKVNNDILIPRSILKKNEVGPREYIRQQEAQDFVAEFDEIVGQGVDSQVSPTEGIVGRQLDTKGPILSPKTFDPNYLEKQYKKMEERQRAELIKQEFLQGEIATETATVKNSGSSRVPQKTKIPSDDTAIRIQPHLDKLSASKTQKEQAPRAAKPNSDLEILAPQPVQASPEAAKEEGPEVKIHKKIIRRAQDDGFF